MLAGMELMWHLNGEVLRVTMLADGGIELLVPVPTAAGRHGVRGRRHAVRAGTVLARRRASRWPLPRFGDTRVLPLPSGPHTQVSSDGMELRAACDGEVMLRNMLIEIAPMYVHAGDLAGSAAIIRSRLPVFVAGSVLDGAVIDAEGEVYVTGSVQDAEIISRTGRISVMGTVTGSASSPTILHAAHDVVCGPACYARIVAGRDVRLLVDARYSTIKAARALHVPQSIERSLIDTGLQVEGGLYPPIEPYADPPGTPDRQHVRVATLLNAYIALHGPPPLAFRVCTLLDVSTRGARCRIDPPMYTLEPGGVVQLRFALPGSGEQLMVLAHVARINSPCVVGLRFFQMTRRDEDRLTTFCMQLVLARSHADLPSPAARGRPSS